jgi:MSHA pilin protein MshC
VELVVVVVLTVVLAAVAVPRLNSGAIDEVQFQQEVKAALRYAQKSAVALRRNVCATFTSNSVSLTVGTTFGAACSAALPRPAASDAYIVTARGSVSFASTPTALQFDARGAPGAGQVISVAGLAAPIVVEAGTGYVH